MNSGLKELERVLHAELKDAQRSRQQGNEGRARVCTRRAAGWAVGWYVEANALAVSHNNALEHLRWLAAYPDLTEELREAASRLTTRIGEDGNMPFRQDPIDDATKIIKELLGLKIRLK